MGLELDLDLLSLVVSALVLGAVVVRDWRAGSGAMQKQLVQLLEETLAAQRDKITRLDVELGNARAEVRRQAGEIRELRDTVAEQARTITALQKAQKGEGCAA